MGLIDRGSARWLRFTALLLALMLVAAACGDDDDDAADAEAGEDGDGEPIPIGVFGGLETPAGDSIVQAAEMAADEINDEGGVHGRPLELTVRDTELVPEQAVEAYQRLGLSDEVVAAIGIWSSGESFAIMDHLSRVELPFLNTGAAATELADLVTEDYDRYKYWFRFMHNSAEIPQPIMEFVSEYLHPNHGVERVAIMTEDAEWTDEVREIMRDWIEDDPNLELVAEEAFDVQTTDFNPIYQRLMAEDPEQIIEISSHVDSAGYTRQWASLEPAPMGGVAVSQIASTFYDETDGAAEGIWTEHYGWPTDITDLTVDFYENFEERFGVTPNYTGTYTYDAMYGLAEALERMDPDDIGDPDALVDALEQTDLTGVLGQWVFQDDHHPEFEGHRDSSVLLAQWLEGGERQVIWPEDIAEGEFVPPSWWDGWDD